MENIFLLGVLVLIGIMLGAIVQAWAASFNGQNKDDGAIVKFIKWRNEIQGIKTEITPTTIKWSQFILIIMVAMFVLIGIQILFQLI